MGFPGGLGLQGLDSNGLGPPDLGQAQKDLELSNFNLYSTSMIKNDKTETVTLTINKSALKKLTRALKQMNEDLDETYTLEQYLEHELNKNTDGLIEMLMSDY